MRTMRQSQAARLHFGATGLAHHVSIAQVSPLKYGGVTFGRSSRQAL